MAEPNVVGDEEVHARQLKRFSERLQLVRHHLDAGPPRRLKQAGIGGGDAVPALGVEPGREASRRIEAALSGLQPGVRIERLRVELGFPEDVETLSLSVVVEAGQAHPGVLPARRRRNDFFDEVLARTNANDAPRGDFGHGARLARVTTVVANAFA